ncbi:MAG: aspartate aminotransferase family protein [Hyphomicrobiales bacterium]|nr:aspartate aminotransferase family protein [Rhabdaerophilum calidifontis]MCA1951580.1 aspartate aminotransferase family protein [Hyphomicrobiales bacterium]MCA1999699.1 aspartate aminotransferase family protein [Hyphomicrobiales bacterium]
MRRPAAESAMMPTYARTDFAFERGEGAWLYTEDGRRFLDFAGGIAVNVLGHAHPHLVKALTDQAQKLWHVSNLYTISGGERLARRLCELTFADRVFFTNSGAEALECAIKTARKYHSANGQPERFRIITFEGAFHGRTLATIAAGGQKKYLEGFGPAMPGFDQVPFGDLDAVKAAIGPETGAILIEPVQGEGGMRAAPPGFLRALRELCDAHGLLLVLDEVQCGVGRTGKLFAYEWAGIVPDIMAVAKGIGGGFPMGACLASEAAAKGMTIGTHGSTYGGNPLAMAVGNAVLDIVAEPAFLEQVRATARDLRQRLAELKDRHPDVIEEIRGEGLLVGIRTRVANTDLVAAGREAGILTVAAGDNVVRLLPPLNIGDAEIREAYARLDAACTALAPAARKTA